MRLASDPILSGLDSCIMEAVVGHPPASKTRVQRKANRTLKCQKADTVRDAIRLVDEQLDALEMIHLGWGEPALSESVRQALSRLEALSGIPLSSSLRRAITSYQLHEALLDFQAKLLNRTRYLGNRYDQFVSDDAGIGQQPPLRPPRSISASALSRLRGARYPLR